MKSETLTELGFVLGESVRPSGANVCGRLELFEKLAPFGAGIAADLGCGRGPYTAELCKRFSTVIGVDIVSDNLEHAARFAPSNAEFRSGALEQIPIASRSIDAAFAIEVLDHVSDVQRSLAEVYRILQPNGKAFVSVPNAAFPIEMHPVKFGSKLIHPVWFPFLNWIPLHDRLATARIFTRSGFSRMSESVGFRVIGSDYFVQPLENRFRTVKPLLQTLSKTHLKPLVSCSILFALSR